MADDESEITELGPLPWLTDLDIVRPGVTQRLRAIIVAPKNIPSHFPYQPHPEGSHKMLYREYVGDSSPASTEGHPGDVWIISDPSHYGAYYRTKNSGWTEWQGLQDKRNETEAHPLLHDKYLSYSITTSGLSWYAWSTIKEHKRLRYRPENQTVAEQVAAYLGRFKAKRTTATSAAPSAHRKRPRSMSAADEWHPKQEPADPEAAFASYSRVSFPRSMSKTILMHSLTMLRKKLHSVRQK